MRVKYNPIIGYVLVDRDYCVIGPAGTLIDPAFASKARARQAARRYGREGDVHEVGALHLAGVLSVIFHDVGDIQLDGQSAQRLVEACRRNGIAVNGAAAGQIDVEEREARYSCRQILTP
jgi:hypothetical protein